MNVQEIIHMDNSIFVLNNVQETILFQLLDLFVIILVHIN